MNIKFMKISEEHRKELLKMMTEFYESDAVATNGCREIFEEDIDECISNSPFLEGFIFYTDEKVAGYSMLAHSFSTEYGKHCVWIEDIFVKKEHHHKGLSTKFFKYLDELYPKTLFKLEVEDYNINAVKSYRKSGFEKSPYLEMVKFSLFNNQQ